MAVKLTDLMDYGRDRSTAAREQLSDRFRGVMVGLAVGNALGLPVEGWSRDEIIRRHPGGVRAIDSRTRLLPWDDDFAQAVLLAEAYLDHEGLELADLGRRLVLWRRENGSGIGLLTARVIEQLERGVPPEDAPRLVWKSRRRNAAGNGCVMRCAPVALRRFLFPHRPGRRESRQLSDYSFRSSLRVVNDSVQCRIGHEINWPEPGRAAIEGSVREGECGDAEADEHRCSSEMRGQGLVSQSELTGRDVSGYHLCA